MRGLGRLPAAVVAVVVLIALLAFAGWLAAEVRQAERKAEQVRLQQLVDYLHADIIGDIEKKIRDRKRAAVSLARNGLHPTRADRTMIALTMEQTPFYRAVAGVDTDLRIQWLESTPGIELVVGQPYPVEVGFAERLEALLAQSELAIDRPLPLEDGDHAVSWFMPLEDNGERLGYLVTVFAVAQALEAFMPDQFRRELDVVVRSGDRLLKPIGGTLPRDLADWPAHFMLDIDGDGSGFDVYARFSAQATASGGTRLPGYVLLSGSLSSILLALALYLGLRNARHLGALERGNLLLREEAESRRQAEAELAHLLTHDRLTGLPNRSGSICHLDGELRRPRDSDGELAVLLIDLDRFQDINDSLGHELGDELLRRVPERIRGALQAHDFLGRQGGDEFIVISRRSDRSEVESLGHSIIHSLDRGLMVSENQIFVSASIGIAYAEAQTRSAEAMIQNSDTALFKAKTSGRGRFAVFAPEMLERVQHRLAMSRDIRRALDAGAFRVVYQPIVDTATLELQGFEALLRWDHEEGRAISPAEFIPVAEETGSIGRLGEFVLREALTDLARWQARLDQPPWLAVNVSAVQLQQPAFLSSLKRLLAENGLQADRVHLEITEEVLIRHERGHRGTLKELEALGVRIVVDDFGVGYSALSYLKNFPVAVVKIDRSFVRDIAHNAEDRAITRTICSLASDLGMATVAEGVESPEQLQLVQGYGCTYTQGYLVARPMERPDIEALVDGGRPWLERLAS